MNTKKVFKNFHNRNQLEITDLVKRFVQEDFFVSHPELQNLVSILITGSVASGFYDNKSDIDLTIVFYNKKLWEKLTGT